MDIGSVDIALESVNMSTAQVQEQAGVSVMKMDMEAQSEIAQALIGQLAEVLPAVQGLGAKVDMEL